MEFEKDYDDGKALRDIGLNKNLNKPISFLYYNYYRSISQYIISNSGDEFDAEDIFQEALLVAIKAIQENKFRAEASLKSYLFAIARNLWISEIRKRKSASRREEIYAAESEGATDGINVKIARKENFDLIAGLFEGLGGRCKRILLLYYYKQYSMKEIMVEEDFANEQVVRNQKYKCLKKLIEKVNGNPVLYQNIKDALKYG
ncbi:RNA polymerase sigma factor, sigma-70 family [Cyclobacterium lianum]|uniref:RNA polymerase sigma factor, sigma-70 family n=1 Tax=Cyclobacterium lianum TaxID=388280 RepID=A0A1M7NU75_9BACT|nr:RNA polymerase sigma factor [Cyclobacterium lianum]SHN07580.1 RNA polymerase sigma factor, sigma-70 family [Cyclobacterium lianum]